MKPFFILILIFSFFSIQAQTSIKGQLQDGEGLAVEFANIALYSDVDSSLIKVETSDETGVFQLQSVDAGNYYLSVTFVGFSDLRIPDIRLNPDQQLDLGILIFSPSAIEMAEATVTASRVMVETKSDRMIFNVQGTINSVGSDAIALLRKAPGVMIDNNDNISVLGRSGVLIYVDGKQLPLTGDDLTVYLQNLPAEQIDRFEIITNPGARYEAQGNAGIIDIRLKKDKNLGANGSVVGTYSQGEYARYNFSGSGNYRNKKLNIYGNAGFGQHEAFHNMDFLSFQNTIQLDENVRENYDRQNYNYRIGTDFFLAKNHTVGFLISGGQTVEDRLTLDRIAISQIETPTDIDSVLIAKTTSDNDRSQNTYNINYHFDNGKGRNLVFDLDYGRYNNTSLRYQPNIYYDANEETILSSSINSFDTPTDIDIYTLKIDYEQDTWGGKLGFGTKISRVVSDNTFLFFDEINGVPVQNDTVSNIFKYDESVYAGYINYIRPINEKWSFSAGLRAEQTVATGDLQAFLPELQEDPVEINYLSWFPSAGLTWQLAEKHSLALNYGRRINRQDYNVLNPFRTQLSKISYRQGNPNLKPEIVNNVELGYTLAHRYNFKLAYSKTDDQITRLIAPDEDDPLANFITWANLAEQTVLSFNASVPVQITKWWNAYFNASASYLDNQADYGDGAIVDLQAYSYSIYQQHTFNLPAGLKGEISGYYSGPGVWGGVFEYETTWSLDLGLQRKFLRDRLNARLSASDLFYQSGWSGKSEFAGLTSLGNGWWDSRRISLSLSYNFGNKNVKSRKRKTGLEEEAGRVGDGG
jgi:outer membrane receptor protein involved in Fe transport